jgi:N-acyl-D-aspartate/D-glutamate deacylase
VLDLVIRGGTVVDGTGAPGVRADVGVRDGRVVTLGVVEDSATRTLDVDGLVVAPGFVDVHTHYDAQLFWDPTASPSPLHGVTTVLGGNCGFSLAPAGEEHADYLMRLMARVEGMPLTALEQGLPWDWTSYGDWLGRLDHRIAVNAGFLVGHSAIRRTVMGEDSVARHATPDEISAMVRELDAALTDGALGFSTSRAPTHNDGAGTPVPSRHCADDELYALAARVGDFPGTSLELVLAGSLAGFGDEERGLMAGLSKAAQRPLNWNVLGVGAANRDFVQSQLEAGSYATDHGGRVVALTLPHSMRIRLNFHSGFVLDGLPGWRELFALPVPERIAVLRDPSHRADLAAKARSPEAGVLRALSHWKILTFDETFSDETARYAGRSVGDVAAERGQEPFDALLDVVIADGLKTGLRPPAMVESQADWETRAEVWRDPRAIIGGSDAGAHLDMMCGAIYSTTVLAEGVRERQVISLEEAVHLLTDVPARLYGLRDRGRVAEGAYADLVVFDPATVGHGPERTVSDLPGGADRLTADGIGIEHVVVNGVEIARSGEFTGATPGAVLRSGRDTETVLP